MRNVTDAFLTSENPLEWLVDLTLQDATNISLMKENIMSNGIKLSQACTSNSTFDIGYCDVARFDLIIDNSSQTYSEYNFENANVRVKVSKNLGENQIESINIGQYYVDSAVNKNGKITITCYDSLYRFNRPYQNDINSGTAQSVINALCTKFGITLKNQRFNNFSVNIKIPSVFEQQITYIQLLSYVAQCTCNNVRINNGQIELYWYAQESQYVIKQNKSETIDTNDITITGIKVITDEKDTKVSKLFGSEGYILSIENNPLMEGKEEYFSKLLGQKLVGLKFRPFTVSSLNNIAYECGDKITLVDFKGNKYNSYINNITYSVGAFQEIKCIAESSTINSQPSFSLVTKAVTQANKITNDKISIYDSYMQQLTNLITNSMGVYKTTEEQDDGSFIYYLHNKRDLSESGTIWKMTSDTLSVSSDSGKTWNAGIDKDGNLVINVLSAIGINADWINAGSISKTRIQGIDTLVTYEDLASQLSVQQDKIIGTVESTYTSRNEFESMKIGAVNLLLNSKDLSNNMFNRLAYNINILYDSNGTDIIGDENSAMLQDH